MLALPEVVRPPPRAPGGVRRIGAEQAGGSACPALFTASSWSRRRSRRCRARFGSASAPDAVRGRMPAAPGVPAGHATFAGAWATMLKAFFDTDAVMTGTVAPSADGSALGALHRDDAAHRGQRRSTSSRRTWR